MRSYARYLVDERALSQSTISHRLPVVREFFLTDSSPGSCACGAFDLGMSADLCSRPCGKRPNHAQVVTTTLRSFLDFLCQEGRLTSRLSAAVPTVASWRRLDLPGFLEPNQVERLLRGCDRSNVCGRRDYAILLLLARLGLRAHEVRQLTLDDIQWATGEVLIRGKGGREDRLPLPPDVGRAVAAYLKEGRPRCSCRRCFSVCPPHMKV